MKRHISPIAIISLAASFCFTPLKTLRLMQAVFAPMSQHRQQDRAKDVPESCPVTKPPAHAFVPPSPYPSDTGPDGFWFGGEKLWTLLPMDGTWKGLPHYRPTDTAFRNKLFWWDEGYDWQRDTQPMLKVTGKRLDSPAPPLGTDKHANAGWRGDSNHPFIVVGIDIPTLGCWKITGNFEDAELSYVVWVTH